MGAWLLPLWALAATPSPGVAQTDTAIGSNLLWLSPGPSDYATLRSAVVAPPKATVFSATAGYQHRPVVLSQPGATHEAVGAQFDVDLRLALGVLERLQVGVAVPITLVQAGVGTAPLTATGAPSSTVDVVRLRDVRFAVDFVPLVRGTESSRDGLGVLLSLGGTAPTGDEFVFASAGRWVFVPQAVVDFRRGPILVAVDLSARLRDKTRRLGAARFASSLVARAGASWFADGDRLSISLEGSAVFELATQSPDTTRQQHAYELGVASRWTPADPGDYSVVGSFSIGGGGFGAPAFRALLGLEYRTRKLF